MKLSVSLRMKVKCPGKYLNLRIAKLIENFVVYGSFNIVRALEYRSLRWTDLDIV
jgi:hypothetical protein